MLNKRWEDLSPKEWIEVYSRFEAFQGFVLVIHVIYVLHIILFLKIYRFFTFLVYLCLWQQIFEDGINESSKGNASVSAWARDRNYLVSPINGVLKYHRLGNQERNDPTIPFEKATFVIADVSLTVTEVMNLLLWLKLFHVCYLCCLDNAALDVRS